MKPSKICIGCEPLGGYDWGYYNKLNFINLFKNLSKYDVNFFDTAAIYGIGKAESRLSEFLGDKINKYLISTKGGIYIKTINNQKKLIIDSSLDFFKNDLRNSLKRLQVKSIYLYSIHHYDQNQEYRFTLDYLCKLKSKGIIKKIGVSNIDLESFKLLCDNYKIDYIHLPINLNYLNSYSNFIDSCKKYNVKILAYNVLYFGLFAKKSFNEISQIYHKYKNTRHRLANIISLEKANKIFSKYKKKNNLHRDSLNKIIKLDGVSSLILGIKNQKQLKQNIYLLD